MFIIDKMLTRPRHGHVPSPRLCLVCSTPIICIDSVLGAW